MGLFIGPVVLAIALAVWREWISQHKSDLFAAQNEADAHANATLLPAASYVPVDETTKDHALKK